MSPSGNDVRTRARLRFLRRLRRVERWRFSHRYKTSRWSWTPGWLVWRGPGRRQGGLLGRRGDRLRTLHRGFPGAERRRRTPQRSRLPVGRLAVGDGDLGFSGPPRLLCGRTARRGLSRRIPGVHRRRHHRGVLHSRPNARSGVVPGDGRRFGLFGGETQRRWRALGDHRLAGGEPTPARPIAASGVGTMSGWPRCGSNGGASRPSRSTSDRAK